ncbi:flavodoxin family protein [Chloroflexota bacterium]
MNPEITILVINGSPRRKNNTSIMVQEALAGAKEIKGVRTEVFEFYKKTIEGCRGDCTLFCGKNGKCVIKDDFNEFLDAWLKADGIIFAAPVYHMGPPGQVKSAIDRLGNVLFAYLKGNFPRFYKVCGAMTQGSSRWGGQEITIQFFLEHFMSMNCLPVTADMPTSFMGVIGYANTWEPGSIREDEVALKAAKVLGRRVAETVRIMKSGLKSLEDELPDEYFWQRIMEQRKATKTEITLDWQKKASPH